MSEQESEDEILDRIEDALRRIGDASVRSYAQPGHGPLPEAALDVAALVTTLDTVIARLRGALATPQPPETE